MNILLTSTGRRTYMVNYFKEALKGIGQVHAANSVETYTSQLADKFVVTPLIYDNSYIHFLFDYCLKNNINAIISLFDIDLPILAKSKQRFADRGIYLLVSNYKFTQICNDKWLTYKFLIKNGFNIPATCLSITQAQAALEKGEIKFPVIIKPRWGMGSIGIFQADNDEELKVLYKKTQNSINDSYLKYESSQDPEKSVIIQEKLIGNEYGLDIFNNLNGEFLTCVPKKKLAMRAGETDGAEIIASAELFKLGEELSFFSKHVGNLDVDCFYTNGKFDILEMNCRFGGQYPFSHLAGVDFPKAIVKMLLNEKVDDNLLKAKVGTIGIKDLVPVKLK
jgi:carbamoyl-phosphate synthase large subunit